MKVSVVLNDGYTEEHSDICDATIEYGCLVLWRVDSEIDAEVRVVIFAAGF